MKNLTNAFTSWLPFAVAIVCIYGVVYLALQQYIRLSANDILVQYALDTIEKVDKGEPLSQVINGIKPIDMQKSLSPFIMIYNNTGTALASTAALHGATPSLPAGVLTNARLNGENRRTWQPEYGVRNAIVVIPCILNGQESYIVAGRSLKEIEKREGFLSTQMAMGILLTLIATYAIILLIHISKSHLAKAAL